MQRYIASCQGQNAAPPLLRYESTSPDTLFTESSSAAHEIVANHTFSAGVHPGTPVEDVVTLSNHQASDANSYAVQATGSQFGDGQPNHVYRLLLRWILKLGGLGVVALVSVLAARYLVQYLDPDYDRRQRAAKAREELLVRLGRTGIETNEHEDMIAKDAVNPASIDVTFDDIGGLDEEKQRLREIVVLPFSRPDLFSRGRLLRPPKGVLLYGPPGTGKTMLAKAIARETRAVFLNVTLSTLQDKWFGESQKLVRAVFTLAWKLQPCIIFIDEIDAFLRERKDSEHESSGNMKAEFMALWDGLASDNAAQVVVVGATNRPWAIDKAILRRLPRPFLIDIPDASQRKEILRKLLREEVVEEGLDLDLLARETHGYSGSDLKELCRAALLAPVQELMRGEREREDAAGGGAAGGGSAAAREEPAAAVALRALTAADILDARRMVGATGVEADEYFRKSTGLSKDDFVRFMNG